MPFGRLDDKANGNAKLLALSDPAWRMWGCALIYCQDNLTDGFVPDHAIHAFGVRAKNKELVADELCSALVPGKGPLWHHEKGGYRLHDYFDWNPSKVEVLKMRADAKDRIARFRDRQRKDIEHTTLPTTEQNALPPPLQNGEQHAHDVVRGSGDQRKGRADRSTAGALGGALPREHLSHTVCDDTFSRCVPAAVHDKLANLLAPKHNGDREAAKSALLTWYPTVWATLQPDFVMGDAFKFWQGHFDAAFASKTGPSNGAKSTVPGTKDTDRYLRDLRTGRRP